MPVIDPDDLDRAEAILDSVCDDWLARDGVSAVDLGFKWSTGQMSNQLAIRVHVVKKKGESELSAGQLFPREVQGIPVDVIEATYAPQALINSKAEAAIEGRGRRFDVVPIGVSVGCRYSTAGTLGAKVVDLDDGQEMILSNWHVLAGRRDVESGLAIWQPGWIDGGTRESNTIATLARWVLGPYDAAVARLTGERQVTTKTLEGRPIEDISEPRLGAQVWKSGRSSGYTEGFVDGIKMTVPLSYGPLGVHTLQRVFRIVPVVGGSYREISVAGDSGSVWVDSQTGKAIGLHFAGETGDTPEHALAHDIKPVLKRLRVRFPAQDAPSEAPPARRPAPAPRPPVAPGYPPRSTYYGDLQARLTYLFKRLFSSN
ncbi:MAG: hypothetical protein JSW55_19530 [Chloroflexota bacterium]|nr:MAG: hypothetical protein JSW55_19530 [Chloroflexota bacterium]